MILTINTGEILNKLKNLFYTPTRNNKINKIYCRHHLAVRIQAMKDRMECERKEAETAKEG